MQPWTDHRRHQRNLHPGAAGALLMWMGLGLIITFHVSDEDMINYAAGVAANRWPLRRPVREQRATHARFRSCLTNFAVFRMPFAGSDRYTMHQLPAIAALIS